MTQEGKWQAVERSLHPFLESITISPALINTIMDSEVSPTWIQAVRELDAKLAAIRSGPRVEGRRSLDRVAEALRLKVGSLSYARSGQLTNFFFLFARRPHPRFCYTSSTRSNHTHSPSPRRCKIYKRTSSLTNRCSTSCDDTRRDKHMTFRKHTSTRSGGTTRRLSDDTSACSRRFASLGSSGLSLLASSMRPRKALWVRSQSDLLTSSMLTSLGRSTFGETLADAVKNGSEWIEFGH